RAVLWSTVPEYLLHCSCLCARRYSGLDRGAAPGVGIFNFFEASRACLQHSPCLDIHANARELCDTASEVSLPSVFSQLNVDRCRRDPAWLTDWNSCCLFFCQIQHRWKFLKRLGTEQPHTAIHRC